MSLRSLWPICWLPDTVLPVPSGPSGPSVLPSVLLSALTSVSTFIFTPILTFGFLKTSSLLGALDKLPKRVSEVLLQLLIADEKAGLFVSACQAYPFVGACI